MRLAINFVAKQRSLTTRSLAMGVTLLFVGSIALALAGWDFWQQAEDNSSLQAQRTSLRNAARLQQGGEVLPADLQGPIEQANATYALLRSPWDDVFQSLEAAYATQETGKASRGEGVDDIALLAVKADASKQEITLTGQARNFNVLSAFTHALAESGKFSQVTLANHKLSDGAAPVVVNFDLRLVWQSPATSER